MQVENPFRNWKKLEAPTLKRILYERDQGPFRLMILQIEDGVAYLAFSVVHDDPSAHEPVQESEIKHLLGPWTRKIKLEDPSLIKETIAHANKNQNTSECNV